LRRGGCAFLAKKRLTAWEVAHDVPVGGAENAFVAENTPPTENPDEAEQFVKDAHERLDGERAGLLVVDTMSRSLGSLDEDKSHTANRYFSMLKAWRAQNGGSTLTVHH
jgi:hypothetical protein